MNENDEKKENNKIILKNKKLKTKIKKIKRYTITIIKIVKDILLKINDNKNINSGEFSIYIVQELNYEYGKYIGNVHNGLRERKGIMNYNDGDRYECVWKNDKMEGKGIYYFNNSNIYEGVWKNNKCEGKGIYYYNDGDRYEGDWKNNKCEGKNIMYYNNGDREIGYFFDGHPIVKHVLKK